MMEQQQLLKLLSPRKDSIYFVFKLTILLVIILLQGCGPKVFISADPSKRLRIVYLNPATYEADLPREKIDYINDSFSRKLAAKGFKLAAPDATSKDYDLIAKIVVASTSSTNLLAIHSNSISGYGSFLDYNLNQIARVDHTETQRGGLLLESGQVIEGIKSTLGALRDQSFSKLADKFVDAIVAKLPAPQGTIEFDDLHLDKSTLNSIGAGRYLGCIESDNALTATIKTGKRIIPLRRAGPGRFCSAFILEIQQNSLLDKLDIVATITGKNGESKEVELKHTPIRECQVEQTIQRVGNRVTWISQNNNCLGANFLVFSAPESSGPFTLNGKLNKISSSVILKDTNSQIVAVLVDSFDLGSSKPIILK